MTLDLLGLIEYLVKAGLLLYLCREVSFHREDTFFLTGIYDRVLAFQFGMG